MASRCTNKTNLQVHHKNRGLTNATGLNDISNAEVLCQDCHNEVAQRLDVPIGDPNFSQSVKDEALRNAGNQCECIREDCH